VDAKGLAAGGVLDGIGGQIHELEGTYGSSGLGIMSNLWRLRM
jgi:hypothetical protein